MLGVVQGRVLVYVRLAQSLRSRSCHSQSSVFVTPTHCQHIAHFCPTLSRRQWSLDLLREYPLKGTEDDSPVSFSLQMVSKLDSQAKKSVFLRRDGRYSLDSASSANIGRLTELLVVSR